jgi:hypothetical protein
MVDGKNDLGMDHEVVAQIGNDLAHYADALAAVRAYAHGDDGLTPEKFGVLAGRTGVGQTYTQLRDLLRDVLDKAAPIVDGMSRSLAASQKQLVETDAEIAMNIARVDGSR